MTESETRVLARTAVVLLLVSAVRLAWDLRLEPAAVAPARDDLPGLLEESRRLEREAERRGRPLGPGERIDPNRAPEPEIDRLPGVGPAVARAIVEARERDGPFGAPEDLLRVRGLGQATLARMRPHLEITPTSRPSRPVVPGRGAGPLSASAAVDLNRATASELDGLPGVGPALSRRILEARTARGGFRSPDDLLEVRGIGPATLERLRPLVRAGPLR